MRRNQLLRLFSTSIPLMSSSRNQRRVHPLHDATPQQASSSNNNNTVRAQNTANTSKAMKNEFPTSKVSVRRHRASAKRSRVLRTSDSPPPAALSSSPLPTTASANVPHAAMHTSLLERMSAQVRTLWRRSQASVSSSAMPTSASPKDRQNAANLNDVVARLQHLNSQVPNLFVEGAPVFIRSCCTVDAWENLLIIGRQGTVLDANSNVPSDLMADRLQWKVLFSTSGRRVSKAFDKMNHLLIEVGKLQEIARSESSWVVQAQLLGANARLYTMTANVLLHLPTKFLVVPVEKNDVGAFTPSASPRAESLKRCQEMLQIATDSLTEMIQLYAAMGAASSTVLLQVQLGNIHLLQVDVIRRLKKLKPMMLREKDTETLHLEAAFTAFVEATELVSTAAALQPSVHKQEEPLDPSLAVAHLASFLRREVTFSMKPVPSPADGSKPSLLTKLTTGRDSRTKPIAQAVNLLKITLNKNTMSDANRLVLHLLRSRFETEIEYDLPTTRGMDILKAIQLLEGETSSSNDQKLSFQVEYPALCTAIYMEAARLYHYYPEHLVAGRGQWICPHIKTALYCYEKAATFSSHQLQRLTSLSDGSAILSSSKLPSTVRLIGRHANILYNAGLFFLNATENTKIAASLTEKVEEPEQQLPLPRASEALGLLDEAIALLDAVQLTQITARMRLNLARCLRQVGLIDKALTQALLSAKLVQQHPYIYQLGDNEKHLPLSVSECYGHVAHLLHHGAMDLTRAMSFYILALKTSGDVTIIKMLQEQFRTPAAATENSDAPTTTDPQETFHQQVALNDIAVTNGVVIRGDVLSWILQSAAACLFTQGKFAHAVAFLEQRLRIGRAVGDPCYSAMFQLLDSFEALANTEGMAYMFQQILTDSSKFELSVEDRLQFATRYGAFHHRVTGDYSKASVWYATALSLDKMNASMMEELAWCLLQLPNPDIQTAAQLYDEAVRTMEVLQAQRKASLAPSSPSDESNSTPAAAAPLHPSYDPVLVFGEAAVFFHDTMKNTEKARHLYQSAVNAVIAQEQQQQTNAATFLSPDPAAPQSTLSHAAPQVYCNFAAFTYYIDGDKTKAMTLFQKSLQLELGFPAGRTFQIANMYVDFLSHSGEEQQALTQVVSMIEQFPDRVSELYHKLARIEEMVGNFAAAPQSIRAVARSYLVALTGNREIEETDVTETALETSLYSTQHLTIALDAIAFCYSKLFKTTGKGALRCYSVLHRRFGSTVFGYGSSNMLALIPLLTAYANCALQLRDFEVAEQLMQEAWCIDSQNPAFVEMFAEFLIQAERLQQDNSHKKNKKKLIPSTPSTSNETASNPTSSILMSSVAVLSAEQLHLQCLKHNPNSSVAHLSYARFLASHLNSAVQALHHFQKSLEYGPKEWIAHHQLGYFYSLQASRESPASPRYTSLCLAAEDAFVEGERLAEMSNRTNVATVQHQHGIHLWSAWRYEESWGYLNQAYQNDEHNPAIVRTCCSMLHEWIASLMNSNLNFDDGTITGMSQSAKTPKHRKDRSSGSFTPPTIGEDKLPQMKLIAEALYKKAVKLDVTDPVICEQYAVFCEEILEKHDVAKEYRELAKTLTDWLEKETD